MSQRTNTFFMSSILQKSVIQICIQWNSQYLQQWAPVVYGQQILNHKSSDL
jgi:hypothetical protein